MLSVDEIKKNEKSHTLKSHRNHTITLKSHRKAWNHNEMLEITMKVLKSQRKCWNHIDESKGGLRRMLAEPSNIIVAMFWIRWRYSLKKWGVNEYSLAVAWLFDRCYFSSNTIIIIVNEYSFIRWQWLGYSIAAVLVLKVQNSSERLGFRIVSPLAMEKKIKGSG